MKKDEMLVITEAKVTLLNRQRFYYEKQVSLSGVTSFGGVDASLKIEKELIEGTVFVNSRGERICLGLTSEASSALRFPFELLDQNAKEIHVLRKRVKAFETMTVIQRLKFLFVGEL